MSHRQILISMKNCWIPTLCMFCCVMLFPKSLFAEVKKQCHLLWIVVKILFSWRVSSWGQRLHSIWPNGALILTGSCRSYIIKNKGQPFCEQEKLGIWYKMKCIKDILSIIFMYIKNRLYFSYSISELIYGWIKKEVDWMQQFISFIMFSLQLAVGETKFK